MPLTVVLDTNIIVRAQIHSTTFICEEFPNRTLECDNLIPASKSKGDGCLCATLAFFSASRLFFWFY